MDLRDKTVYRNRNWMDSCRTLGLLGIALAMAFGSTPANAKEWILDNGTRIQLDSFFTLATSIRTEGTDCDQVASANGGCNAVPRDVTQQATGALNGRLLNSDDGNLNVKKGDVYTLKASAIHDLAINYKNFGGFGRFAYFYDFIQDNNYSDGFPRRTKLANESIFQSNPFEGGAVGYGYRILDLYAYMDADILDRSWDFRIGNQVLAWGEEVYTQGGLKVTNALDVTKLRIAGAELREALIPAPMIRASGTVFGDLTFDGYYQFGWNKTEVDPTGTMFSVSDMISRGAEGQFSMFDPGGSMGFSADTLFSWGTTFGGMRYSGDEDPSDQGQWGVALRYWVDPIETEIGLFYNRFHAKTPTVSMWGRGMQPAVWPVAYLGPRVIPFIPEPVSAHYFTEYPEDITIYGASFSTVLGGIALAGEFSYRPNQPTPITSTYSDLVTALATGSPTFTARGMIPEERGMLIVNGTYVPGPSTPVFGSIIRCLGADDMNIVGEIGMMHYFDLDSDTAYAGPSGVYTGFFKPDDTAWGYVVRVGLNYTRVFGTAVNVAPSFTWQHDVSGTPPDGGASYIEDRKRVGVELVGEWQKTWKGILSYSSSYGAGKANTSNDRDFLSLSISYAF